MKRLTTEKFIKRSQEKHKNKYDYSQAIYINAKTKIKIKCPNHGVFYQIPHKHLNGQGCYNCKKIKTAKLRTKTTEKFIEQSKNIHGDKYDYSLTKYINQKEKVILICKYHNKEFKIRPGNHLNKKQGCKSCSSLNKLISTLDFINEAQKIHYFKYDYSKIPLISHVKKNTKVEINCPVHKKFFQKINAHLRGAGCPYCAKEKSIKNFKLDEKKLTKESFIEKANLKHNFKYIYKHIKFKNVHTKINIECPKHGFFSQMPNSHLSGKGCPFCKNKNEALIKDILVKLNINFKHQYFLNDLKIRVDYFLPNSNLIIEYNGKQHYEPVNFGKMNNIKVIEKFKKQQLRDQQLRNYCKDNNIQLLEIDGRKYNGNKLIKFIKEYLKGFL